MNLQTALNALGYPDSELSILLTDDVYISQLNHRYLGRKGPTNVLAFPMQIEMIRDDMPFMLGDIVVSVDTASREAKEIGEEAHLTVTRLLIHGLLHLVGYDHEASEEEAENMEREETRLMELLFMDEGGINGTFGC